MIDATNSTKIELITARLEVLRLIRRCDTVWGVNRIHKLQVEASRLANEIAKAK